MRLYRSEIPTFLLRKKSSDGQTDRDLVSSIIKVYSGLADEITNIENKFQSSRWECRYFNIINFQPKAKVKGFQFQRKKTTTSQCIHVFINVLVYLLM